MEIKNIVTATANVSSLNLPSWEMIDGYNLMDVDKRHSVLSRDVNVVEHRILFYDDLVSFKNGLIEANIYIHKRLGIGFDSTPLFSFNKIKYSDLIDNTFIFEMDSKKLVADGEYIVKVLFDVFSYPNETLNTNTIYRIEQSNKKLFSYANKEDYYFSYYYEPSKPSVSSGVVINENLNTLRNYSFITDKSTSSFMIPTTYTGDILLSVGGITLSEDFDYTIEGNVVLFNDIVPNDTVINVSYSGSDNSNGLQKDTFNILTTNLKSSKESFENEYFLRNDGLFGLFLSKFIANNSQPILIINGVTLSYGIDFKIDESDSRKLILFGELKEFDVIDVYYIAEYQTLNTNTNVIEGVVSINTPISNEKGRFLVKFSNDYTFQNEIGTISIDYVSGESEYPFSIKVNEPGVYYIKVINQKDIKILENETFMFNIGNTIKLNVDF